MRSGGGWSAPLRDSTVPAPTSAPHTGVWQSVTMPRTLVAIPALNEAATIGSVIAEVRRAVPRRTSWWSTTAPTTPPRRRAHALARRWSRCRSTSASAGRCARPSCTPSATTSTQSSRWMPTASTSPPTSPTSCAALEHASVVVGARFDRTGLPRAGPPPLGHAGARAVAAPGLPHPPHGHDLGLPGRGPRAIALFARHYPAEYLGDTVESLVIAARSGLVGRPRSRCEMRPRQGGTASHSPLRRRCTWDGPCSPSTSR